jgi:hypothetical protein
MNTHLSLRMFVAAGIVGVVSNVIFGFSTLAGYIGGTYLFQVATFILRDTFSANNIVPGVAYALVTFILSFLGFVLLLRRFSVKKLIELIRTNPFSCFKYLPSIIGLGFFAGICGWAVFYLILLVTFVRLV